MKRIIIYFAVFLLLLCGPVYSDTVYLQDRTLENTIVEKITSSKVILSAHEDIPLNKVKKIEFSRFILPAKPGGIILSDGSILNGIIREADERVVFRSTSFGILKFKKEQIAGIYYDASTLLQQKKKEKQGMIITKQGNIYRGKIVWFDMISAAIITPDGLKKIENKKISLVRMHPVPLKHRVILRNGDILNSIDPDNTGSMLDVVLSGIKASISLKAVKQINF